MEQGRLRHLYLLIGWICTTLGVVGALLPVMPTTPFLIVAVWAFSKSSPRLREWLYHHPRYGATIQDWYEHGAVSLPIKVFAIVTMSLSIPIAYFLTEDLMLSLIHTAVIILVALFLISRPSRRSD